VAAIEHRWVSLATEMITINNSVSPVNSFCLVLKRDGSACVSYTLEKGPNSQENPAVKWIPYNPVPFETDEMPFRHEQLQIRTRECSQTLELLSKLNEGSEIEHILQPTMDLAKFKVSSS
jgi:platelet-activating factor acetylhydrolase